MLTLEDAKKSWLFQKRDLSRIDAGEFLLKALQEPKGTRWQIGVECLQFYLFNHLRHEIEKKRGPWEPLSASEREVYSRACSHGVALGARMLSDIAYLLVTHSCFITPSEFDIEDVEESYGKTAARALSKMGGTFANNTWWTDGASLLPKVKQMAMEMHGVPLPDALRAMALVLERRQRDLAYGPLWSDVARMTARWATGAKNLEATIDTAFTFCHCSGSFFEKGLYFSANGDLFFDALDTQRAGLIPQYCKAHKGCASSLKPLISEMYALLPEPFDAPAKWSDVKKVSRDELNFTSRYKSHWNQAWRGGGGGAQHQAKPIPKIFNPLGDTEDEALENYKLNAGMSGKTGFFR